jgi:uncharacterized membrane protein
MEIRKTVTRIVGSVQTAVGALAVVFAFLLLHDALNVQVALGISGKNIELYMWVFIVFGLLSVISGLFLFYEQ